MLFIFANLYDEPVGLTEDIENHGEVVGRVKKDWDSSIRLIEGKIKELYGKEAARQYLRQRRAMRIEEQRVRSNDKTHSKDSIYLEKR